MASANFYSVFPLFHTKVSSLEFIWKFDQCRRDMSTTALRNVWWRFRACKPTQLFRGTSGFNSWSGQVWLIIALCFPRLIEGKTIRDPRGYTTHALSMDYSQIIKSNRLDQAKGRIPGIIYDSKLLAGKLGQVVHVCFTTHQQCETGINFNKYWRMINHV